MKYAKIIIKIFTREKTSKKKLKKGGWGGVLVWFIDTQL
jgi:hypothetical protein